MVPGVAALVVRRRRKEAILVLRLPVRLASEVFAMTRGAMGHIDGLAAGYKPGIVRLEKPARLAASSM